MGQFVKDGTGTYYTLIEIRKPGSISNILYRGNSNSLGVQVELSELAETDGLEEVVETGINHLMAVYVPGYPAAEGPFGVSDLSQISDLLTAINETASALQDRARRAKPLIYASEDLIESSTEVQSDGTTTTKHYLDTPTGPTVVPIATQYGDDKKPILNIEWPKPGLAEFQDHLDALINMTLEQAGISPPSVGRAVNGAYPESGVARRLQMANTMALVGTKARSWESALNEIMNIAVEFDIENGLAPEFQDVQSFAISVNVKEGVPDDISEITERAINRYEKKAASLETTVAELHPDWTDQQVLDEVTKIQLDKADEGEDSSIPTADQFLADLNNPPVLNETAGDQPDA